MFLSPIQLIKFKLGTMVLYRLKDRNYHAAVHRKKDL